MTLADQVLDPSIPRHVGVTTTHDRRLRDAFGTFATGVVAVAAEIDQRPLGMAVSSFTSVSIDPPLVSMNLATASTTWPALRRADRLGITVLAADQAAVCRSLAGASERRFDQVDHVVSRAGAITLLGGLATFECSIYQEVAAGDHRMVLLRVHETWCDEVPLAPLIFHRSALAACSAPPGH